VGERQQPFLDCDRKWECETSFMIASFARLPKNLGPPFVIEEGAIKPAAD
jgi:hypothetical protein